MFTRLLIANRGEIARRIIRTAQKLGLETVAIYSDVDRDALHVREADFAIGIGPAPAQQSYLAIENIIAAAKRCKADAIHPGYGFLSESPDFAEACRAEGISFVGPSAETLRLAGDKAAAKRLAVEISTPVVPGQSPDDQSLDALRGAADSVGYPLLIKAVAGGGGRGMRLVRDAEDLADALAGAKREAAAAFGDDRVMIEKFIDRPRHIEVQIFADRHGNVVHLFDRDCTMQRRNQKVIEEAPAPGISDKLRVALSDAACRLAAAANYEGAGTVEFLLEPAPKTDEAAWYFIEMNARLQVEHPVTEAVTGLDLVEWQLRVAAGEKLPLQQRQIKCVGHAVEARVCAEDADNSFAPSLGPIIAYREPGVANVRIDTGVTAGSEITPYYDSLIAKVVCHSNTRAEAIDGLTAALQRFSIAGPITNIGFLIDLLGAKAFVSAAHDIGLIDRQIATASPPTLNAQAVIAGAGSLLKARQQTADRRLPEAGAQSPWQHAGAFQIMGQRQTRFTFLANGEPCTVTASWTRDGRATVALGAQEGIDDPDIFVAMQAAKAYVISNGRQVIVSWPAYDVGGGDEAADPALITAPITGRLASLAAETGDKVLEGQTIAVVEAMKMEHIVRAGRAGTIATVMASVGDQVSEGQTLATFTKDDA